MKHVLLVLLLYFILNAASEDITGYWKTEKGKAIFSIYKNSSEFEGKIIWLDSSYVDSKNPDESLRSRPILGLISMEKLKYNSKKNKWVKGKIYDSESGKTYSCEVTISDDLNSLFLRGYAGISLLGRTTTWTKVNKDSFVINSIGKNN